MVRQNLKKETNLCRYQKAIAPNQLMPALHKMLGYTRLFFKHSETQNIRSNNDGFVAMSENYEPILDAFSHWTHEVSQGQMLVVDLQVD